MARYELSIAADRDFEGIFHYGIDRFGVARALAYQNGLTQRFADLGDHPERYPAVDHIRQGYRRSVYGAHAINYGIAVPVYYGIAVRNCGASLLNTLNYSRFDFGPRFCGLRVRPVFASRASSQASPPSGRPEVSDMRNPRQAASSSWPWPRKSANRP